jgi:hypothetical protein
MPSWGDGVVITHASPGAHCTVPPTSGHDTTHPPAWHCPPAPHPVPFWTGCLTHDPVAASHAPVLHSSATLEQSFGLSAQTPLAQDATRQRFAGAGQSAAVPQPHHRRPVASLGWQFWLQQSPGFRQIVPAGRQTAADAGSRTTPANAPANATPAARKRARRDRDAASERTAWSNREPSMAASRG